MFNNKIKSNVKCYINYRLLSKVRYMYSLGSVWREALAGMGELPFLGQAINLTSTGDDNCTSFRSARPRCSFINRKYVFSNNMGINYDVHDFPYMAIRSQACKLRVVGRGGCFTAPMAMAPGDNEDLSCGHGLYLN